jgi:amidase
MCVFRKLTIFFWFTKEQHANGRFLVRREYEDLLRTYDALLLPSVPFTAPPLFDREQASTWEVVSSTFGQTLNTLQFNLTGHPAMTFPTGMRADMSGKDADLMLPVGMQLVSRLHGESTLLQLGYAFEKAFDWKKLDQ